MKINDKPDNITTYPVIQVVNRDHQDVGLVGEGRCGPDKDGQEEQEERCGRHGRSYEGRGTRRAGKISRPKIRRPDHARRLAVAKVQFVCN